MALHWKIIIGLLAGIAWAVLSTFVGLNTFTLNWIDPFGEIFIRLLKLIAVPMVLFSIIKGVTGMPDLKVLGRIGFKTLALYLITTVMAVCIGLGVVNTLRPGNALSKEVKIDNRIKYEIWAKKTGAIIKDGKCLSCLEINKDRVVEAEKSLNEESKNETINKKVEIAQAVQQNKPLQFLVDIVPENIFLSLNDMTLMLQVIFFAVFFGVALVMLPINKAKPALDVIDSFNEVFLKMVDIVMLSAPYFVFALTAGLMGKLAGDDPAKLLEMFKALGSYALTVVFGLSIMLFGVYPLLRRIMIGKSASYAGFFRGMGSAQLLAFSSSSSAATLPVTMECVNENLKVPKQISDFVLPIGATVNMDGTSMYQAIAVVFLAQFHLIDLDFAQQLTIVLMATLASIGAAAVPGAGLIMLIIVLGSVGLNPAWIAVILPVDRILDMCRTVVNITGDAAVATIVAEQEK
jgi:Na+/H+-dicarboxylate symporter